ncbi:RNA polymerase sigma-70 factor, ECF subfamily [Duganella sp. CF517]|uniref:sigma-70 family RNA polymerase sigma factor n=1 Tax=Duganella sp. CF517 TaxID=1881038 RepID=UPI0008B3D978|nr:sigma-70 family RNA polymerase sigma factor [Duganella sp. CF517]SEO01589.1 RNA polymerase sigma-70 factor, ECF subfamily [Duganella sp. CF517]
MLAASLHSEQVKSIYDAHHGWLECWLRKRLGNASDAADIAQDTFVRVLAREMAIREPRAMLTTIAQGMVANFYRRRDIELAYEQALAAWPEQHAMSPETRAIMLETLVEIDALLSNLAPLVREAFLLSQLDGMAQADIAARLGISLATVKRHIAKAMLHCCFGD